MLVVAGGKKSFLDELTRYRRFQSLKRLATRAEKSIFVRDESLHRIHEDQNALPLRSQSGEAVAWFPRWCSCSANVIADL